MTLSLRTSSNGPMFTYENGQDFSRVRTKVRSIDPEASLDVELTLMTLQFESMQTNKCHLVKHSKDPNVAALYKRREERFRSHNTIWRPTHLLSKAITMVEHDHKFQSVKPGDKRGLGHGLFTAALPSTPEHRKLCTAAVRSLGEERHVAHGVQLAMQGVWTNWADQVTPFDFPGSS